MQVTGAAVSGSIDIGLHEIGLSGEATGLAIGRCDVDSRETRPGMSIVTGTIQHRNATVLDLTFDDRTEETLGVTANHPLRADISEDMLQLPPVRPTGASSPAAVRCSGHIDRRGEPSFFCSL